jgi:hypothetical protein
MAFPRNLANKIPQGVLLLSLDPKAVSLDVEDDRVMQQAVEHGRDLQRVLEDLRPAADIPVGTNR